MVDATWTTSNESDNLISDQGIRKGLIRKANLQDYGGIVSWGGYIFHVYKEIAEEHSINISEYPVPGNSKLGYRVQNKINQPSRVVLDVMMVTTGVLSAKQAASASFFDSYVSGSMSALSTFLDVTPWVVYPLGIGGIVKKLKEAMYKGWALPYNGKYGRIENMLIEKIETLDNEETVYGVPIKIHLRQVLGINHRATNKKNVSSVTAPVCKL